MFLVDPLLLAVRAVEANHESGTLSFTLRGCPLKYGKLKLAGSAPFSFAGVHPFGGLIRVMIVFS